MQQVKFVLEHPEVGIAELAALGQQTGVYSPRTWLREVVASIATIRHNKELDDRRGRKPDKIAKMLAEIASNKPSEQDAERMRASRKMAIKAVEKYLSDSGWQKRKVTNPRELPFWKDSKVKSFHRLDMAFFIALNRGSELERLMRQRRLST